MKALRDNREYTIVSEEKDRYVNSGFDIYDDDGEKVESGKGRNVSLKEYNRLKDELEEAKKAAETNASVADESLIPVLQDYASLKGIDIGQATTLKGIFTKIKDAEKGADE